MAPRPSHIFGLPGVSYRRAPTPLRALLESLEGAIPAPHAPQDPNDLPGGLCPRTPHSLGLYWLPEGPYPWATLRAMLGSLEEPILGPTPHRDLLPPPCALLGPLEALILMPSAP